MSLFERAMAVRTRQITSDYTDIREFVEDIDFSGVKDVTDKVQQAADYAAASRITRMTLPHGHVKIGGSVNIKFGTIIDGENGSEVSKTNTQKSFGTTVIATPESTSPVFNFSPDPTYYGANGMMKGGGFRNVHILGSDNWNTGNNAVNRVAVNMERVQTEFLLDNLYVTGFKGGAVNMSRVYDGHGFGCRFMFCGVDNVNPGLAMLSDSSMENNTNAIHFFGLHMEHCPFMLKVNGMSRHIQFIASKFEINAFGPSLSSPIQLENAYNLTFGGGTHFISRAATEKAYYSDPNQQPHFVSIKGGGLIDFGSSDFTTNSTDGARWIKQDSTSTAIVLGVGAKMNNLYCGGGEYPIILKSNNKLESCILYTKSQNNKRQLIQLIGSNNSIENNLCMDTGSGTTPDDSSNMFLVAAERNSFYNTITGATPKKILGGDQQFVEQTNVRVRDNISVSLEVNSSTPSVGYIHASASNSFKMANTIATTITDLLDGREGQSVEIMCINGTATTFTHTAGKMVLKSGANTIVQGFGKFIRFIRRAGVWYET